MIASQCRHQLLRLITRKEAIKVLIKLKAKAVESTKCFVKNRNSNDFFLRSQLLNSSVPLGSKTNTGTEVGIAVEVIFVTSLPPLLQSVSREACQSKDYQG